MNIKNTGILPVSSQLFFRSIDSYKKETGLCDSVVMRCLSGDSSLTNNTVKKKPETISYNKSFADECKDFFLACRDNNFPGYDEYNFGMALVSFIEKHWKSRQYKGFKKNILKKIMSVERNKTIGELNTILTNFARVPKCKI